MKDVIISIKGIQTDEGDEECVELITDGQYRYSKEESILTYMESEITGMEGTRTRITVNPTEVIMSREGRQNSQMIFREGRKHTFLYETPYGAATMGVNTHKIRSRLGENGGDLEIDYAIDLDHTVVEKNKFKINVRETKRNDVKWQI